MGAVAAALYNAIQTGATPNLGTEKLNALVKNAAADLKKGNGLVVAGSNDVAVQTVVNAINSAVGANGTTINWAVTSNYKQGIDADFVGLVQAMNAGQVDTLIMQNVNPVYESAMGDQFESGLSKVANTITFASHLDETAQKCKYSFQGKYFPLCFSFQF
jgi:molybdopterin-containing oxidoreductase family iron-sulfur binding subunit